MARLTTLRKPQRRTKEAGQASVEFAFSVMTFLFLLFCCWELLMGIYTVTVLSDAAKEGVRLAIVKGSTGGTSCGAGGTANPCSADPFSVGGRVTGFAQLSMHDVSKMTVSVQYLDNNNDPGSRVQVTVSYQYVPYINLGFFNPTLSTSAEGRIVY